VHCNSVQCTADEIQGTCISRDLGASPHTVKSNRYGGVSPYTTTWPYFAMGHQLNCQVLSLTDENGSDLDSVGSHFISGITFQRNPHRCIHRYSQFANCLVLSFKQTRSQIYAQKQNTIVLTRTHKTLLHFIPLHL